MKRLLVLIVFGIVGFTYQSHAQAGFRLGVKGGLNFANVDRDISTDSRTGFHAGAFATIKLSKLAIQPELIYSAQGADLDFGGGFGELESRFNYLNIPILLKLYLLAGLNLQLGPQFGFLLSGDQEFVDEFGEIIDGDASDFINGSDVSLGIGAGWDLPFGLTVDARYNLGLSDVNDVSGGDEVRNQVFQVSLGYRLITLGK